MSLTLVTQKRVEYGSCRVPGCQLHVETRVNVLELRELVLFRMQRQEAEDRWLQVTMLVCLVVFTAVALFAK